MADNRADNDEDNGTDERLRGKALLSRFLPRAMADGTLDEIEKQQLMGILTSGVCTKDDVQEVFRDYLMGLHGEIVADGVITIAERAHLKSVIAALRIPASFLPAEIVSLLGNN